MATIPLTNSFQICPAGVHVFLITGVNYDQEFGKIEVQMVTAEGISHSERFALMKPDGTMNDKACGAFSFFAKTALNDFTLESIDHTELIGHYIKGEILHTQAPSNKDPSKTVTFANMGDKSPADGFEKTPCTRVVKLLETLKPANEAPQVYDRSDLDSLLS